MAAYLVAVGAHCGLFRGFLGSAVEAAHIRPQANLGTGLDSCHAF